VASEASGAAAAQPATVVVLDRVRVTGEALAAYLESRGFDVIGVAKPGSPEALDLLKRLRPALAVVNANDGGLCLRRMRQLSQTVKFVAIGVPEDEETVLRYAEAGMDAFATCDESLTDLVERLNQALRGEASVSPHLAASLLRRVADLSGGASSSTGLTAREVEVARLLRSGLSNKEIASELEIGLATVKNHVHNILNKLGVRTRAAVIAASGRIENQ
jgi:DNA-binding NarL/FixJ family response regulator